MLDDEWADLGRAVIEGIPDAVVFADREGAIRFWNAGAARIFGFSAEEAIGRSVLMLIPERLHGEEDDIIARIRRGESVPPFETIRRRKDGALLNISLTVSPLRNDAGRIIGASKIAHDITRRIAMR